MGTGLSGAFMLAWAQTRVDGRPANKNTKIAEGLSFSWRGLAQPLDGGSGAQGRQTADRKRLRERAARVVRKLIAQQSLHHPAPAQSLPPAGLSRIDERRDISEEDLYSGHFVLSDGRGFWVGVPVPAGPGRPPFLFFPEGLPPERRELMVIEVAGPPIGATPGHAPTGAVICFTPGTRLRTEDGERAIEEIGPGTRLLTRDSGPRAVIWTGHRTMSGARLRAMPHLRPIRFRAGALGIDRPDADLLVSPEHRVLWQHPAARDLFGEDEVLVRAGDLAGDRAIGIDHRLNATRYIHVMLERHEVIWANGLAVETFHPGLAPAEELTSEAREGLFSVMPDLAHDPDSFGPPVRRIASRADAALLRYAAAS